MAIKTINDEHLVNIAAAIRSKNGETTTYKPSEMAAAIAAITTGGGSGGGSSIVELTPDEIYEQQRPVEWPVLPDPTEDNEVYYLCATTIAKTCACPSGFYDRTKAAIDFGYIDDNGAFVTAYTLNSGSISNSYWSGIGISGSWVSPQMDKYYVIRTRGGDSTFENCTSSSNSSSSMMRDVLEIKARLKNPYFNSEDPGGYSDGFINASFITLYGPQEWTASKIPKKFNCFYGLKCLRFDSEENNPFLKPNTTFKDINRLFNNCMSLRHTYPILENWTAVTNIDYLYYGCHSLKKLTLESTSVTSASYTYGTCHGLEELSIKLPNITTSQMTGSSTPYMTRYTNLDVSGLTGYSYHRYLTGYRIEEVLNYKTQAIDLSSGSAARPNYGGNCLKRLTMSPEQTGDNMPTKWRVHLHTAGYPELKEFFESLPTVTGGNTITLYNYAFRKGMPDELLSIVVNKGYTLTVS